MIRKKILMTATPLFVISGTDAAVSLDRTRAVFDGSEKSMTLDIPSDDKQLPCLTQTWIENENQGKTIAGPVIATPPVQRLEPSAKNMVRLGTTPDISRLPQDRESLFYSSFREIPPRSEKADVPQIVLQTKIKFFCHSAAIKTRPNEVWQNRLTLNKVNGGHRIEDPTPYYVTVIGLGGSEKQAKEGELETVMLSPRSEQTVKPANYNTLYLSYTDDYGGRPVLSFVCSGSCCSVKKEEQCTAVTAKYGWDIMVVNRTAAVLYLIALSLSSFTHIFLWTKGRGIYDDVFTVDKLHHCQINERGGRIGSLVVSDALLSPPCILVSSEVPLSLRPENHPASIGAPLTLRLAGYGDGGALQPGKRGVAMTVFGSLVTGPGTGSALFPGRKLPSCNHLVTHDDDTFLLCRPDRRQEKMLTIWRKKVTQEGEHSDARSNSAMLRLSIKYE